MADTVADFIRERVSAAIRDYAHGTWFLQRLVNKNNPHQVYLSPELFERLVKEQALSSNGDSVSLDGLVILNKRHPENPQMDFVVDVKSHYPIGYNTKHYGLKDIIRDGSNGVDTEGALGDDLEGRIKTIWYEAVLLVGTGKPLEAVPLYRKLIELDPANEHIHLTNIAVAQLRAGQPEDAMVSITSALKINPEYGYAHGVRAGTLERLGVDDIEVFELSKKALSMEPDNVILQYNVGVGYAANEDYEEAIALLKNVVRNFENYFAHFTLARCYLAKGDVLKAFYHTKMAYILSKNDLTEKVLANFVGDLNPELKAVLSAKIGNRKFIIDPLLTHVVDGDDFYQQILHLSTYFVGNMKKPPKHIVIVGDGWYSIYSIEKASQDSVPERYKRHPELYGRKKGFILMPNYFDYSTVDDILANPEMRTILLRNKQRIPVIPLDAFAYEMVATTHKFQMLGYNPSSLTSDVEVLKVDKTRSGRFLPGSSLFKPFSRS